MDTREAGRLGGLKKSERKAAACRENGKRPKRKRAATPAPQAVVAVPVDLEPVPHCAAARLLVVPR